MKKLLLPSFLMTGAGIVLAFITHLVLAKLLNVDEYGIYNFILSLSSVLSVFALLGFQNAAVRLIPVFQQDENGLNLIRQYYRFTILSTITLAIAISVLVYSLLLALGYADTYPIEACLMGVGLTLVISVSRLLGGFLRGYKHSALSIGVETTFREISLLMGIGIALAFAIPIDHAGSALILLLIAYGFATITAYIALSKILPERPGRTTPLNKPMPVRDWLFISLPMMLIVFAQRLLRRTDIIVLGLMVDPALVGAYALAILFADVAGISDKAVMPVYSPRAAEYYKKGEYQNLARFTKQIRLVITAGTFLGCGIIGFTYPYIIPLFGEGFDTAYKAMIILMTGTLISQAFGPLPSLMIMTRLEKQAMAITFAIALLNLTLNPVMIYLYSIEGAAMTTAFMLVLRSAVCRYIIYRENLYGLGT